MEQRDIEGPHWKGNGAKTGAAAKDIEKLFEAEWKIRYKNIILVTSSRMDN